MTILKYVHVLSERILVYKAMIMNEISKEIQSIATPIYWFVGSYLLLHELNFKEWVTMLYTGLQNHGLSCTDLASYGIHWVQ